MDEQTYNKPGSQSQKLTGSLPSPHLGHQPLSSHQPNNKTLLRLENPLYELRRTHEGESEFVVRKNMVRKSPKPKIQAIKRSPLLSQLEAVIPIFRKANQELQQNSIPDSDKIDLQLEQVYSSSQSSDKDSNSSEKDGIKFESMLDSQRQDAQKEASDQIELNFLRYSMPTSESHEKVEIVKQSEITKKNMIQQL